MKEKNYQRNGLLFVTENVKNKIVEYKKNQTKQRVRISKNNNEIQLIMKPFWIDFVYKVFFLKKKESAY